MGVSLEGEDESREIGSQMSTYNPSLGSLGILYFLLDKTEKAVRVTLNGLLIAWHALSNALHYLALILTIVALGKGKEKNGIHLHDCHLGPD